MKKDCTRDYITSAFRLYARLGKPTYEQAEQKIYSEVYNKFVLSNPEIAVMKAEETVQKKYPELCDIAAVNGTIKLLKDGNKDYIVDAIEAVYFFNPSEPIHKKDISNRVRKFAIECPCDESSVYRWLRQARTLCASVRGLRIDDSSENICE